MKKVISIILVFAMFVSLATTAFANDSVAAEHKMEDAGCEEQQDYSGQLFTQMFGDSEYQVTGITPDDELQSIDVGYISEKDSTLFIYAYDDDNGRELFSAELAVDAGDGNIPVAMDLGCFPEFYRIEAFLANENACSETYTYYEHTHEYEDFLATTTDDAEFADQVILDYGEDVQGRENFAVVSSDVKVVYVESMDDVDFTSSDGEAALFGLFETPSDEYVFTDVLNQDVLNDLGSGDKLLIFPMDDVNTARMITVDDVEERADLFSEDGEPAVAVTADEENPEMDEFFDFIRLNIEFEADTDDLDTSDCDDDVEFDETADLFGSTTVNFTRSKKFTADKSQHNILIKDTITVTSVISFKLEYKVLSLKSLTVSYSLTTSNNFIIYSSKAAEWSGEINIGTINIGTYYGVTFTIPVAVTFACSFGATFRFEAYQSITAKITAKYSGGSYSCTTSTTSSCGKELESRLKATVSMGIKPTLKASLAVIDLSVSVSADVGFLGIMRAESVNSTKTYVHNCLACLDCELDLYLIPSFNVKFYKKTLAGKTWEARTKYLMGFYASLHTDGTWHFGTGACPNKRCLVTIKVLDNKNNKPLSGVKVSGFTKLTDSKGQTSEWLAAKKYSLTMSKSGYTSRTVSFSVNNAGITRTEKLAKAGTSRDVYYTMSDWNALSVTERQDAITAAADHGVSITLANAADLRLLADYTNGGGITDGIIFVMNGVGSVVDLSGSAWTPIGTMMNPFRGEFDGNGFELTGMTVQNVNTAGLFGVTNGAIIHDLSLTSLQIGSATKAGGIAGSAENETTIYDVFVSGAIEGSNTAGGIAGELIESDICNSFANMEVGGVIAGGIAGRFDYTMGHGQISNCYFAGEVQGTGSCGGICGEVNVDTTPVSAEESEEVHTVGVQYAYYLDGAANNGVGSADEGADIKAYAVTEAQANGTEDSQPIYDQEGFTTSVTLLEALNKWYAVYGAYYTEEEAEAETDEIPEGSPSDYFNKWYADEGLTNGGYPLFAPKSPVYPLIVYYVYEDGSEAKPAVRLYLEEGQAYEVDSYVIPGYTTNEVVYTGTMPATELEYKVIYSAEAVYDGTCASLNADSPATAGGTYSVSNAADLAGLAAYVNGGGNTEGVNFLLIDDVTMPAEAWTPIGTEAHPFKGNFDGQGLNIANLTGCLFGSIDGAKVSGIQLKSVSITGTGSAIGAVAGNAKNSELKSCVVDGSINVTAENAGGILGVCENVKMDACSFNGTVIGSGCVGGIMASGSASTVTNSAVTATVTGASTVGGLAGSCTNCQLANNFVKCVVSGSENVGGIIGSATTSTVKNTYQFGTVACDGVCGTAFGSFDGNAENVFVVTGSAKPFAGSGSTEGISAYDGAVEEEVQQLLDSLNHWVDETNTKDFLTWSSALVDEGTADLLDLTETVPLPIFGIPYDNWITEFKLDEGKVSLTFEKEFYGNGAMYVAEYDESGRFVDFHIVETSGTSVFDIAENTACVKAFLLEDCVSVCEDRQITK